MGKALAGHPGSQSLMGGSVRRPPWIPEPNGGKPQVATLDPRALSGKAAAGHPARAKWGEASGGHPGSQSLIGRSVRRPLWTPQPYRGKRQPATLDPRALLGEAAGGHPGSRSLNRGTSRGYSDSQILMGGSFCSAHARPPWIPEPYGGEASGGHPGSQSVTGASLRRASWIQSLIGGSLRRQPWIPQTY